MTVFFICAMLQTTPAAWAASRPVPQIAGLTLGMTSDDALAALKTHSINATAVMNHWCMADFLVDHVHPYQGRGHCVQLITARYLGGDLLVFFTEDIPARPGVAVLTTIALNYPPQSALEPLIGQLGEPSLTDGQSPWIVAMWCFDFPCTSMDHVLGDPNSGTYLGLHRGAGFTLTNNGFENQRFRAEVRILAAHGIQHPEI